MSENNRICKVCGKEYKFCPTCKDGRFKPSWYKTFDCEQCKLIFDTAVQVTCGHISALNAQKILKKCNLNQKFDKDLQKVVDTIKSAKRTVVVLDDANAQSSIVKGTE